uniref:P-type ATPase N-terminal domain-containing protein n=1 Tax=Panagrolaimus sp. ES5 TaxID=591445 RepID=A0AC34GAD0_9BILA
MNDALESTSSPLSTLSKDITDPISDLSTRINDLSTRISKTRTNENIKFSLNRFFQRIFKRQKVYFARTINIGKNATLSTGSTKFRNNAVCNTKYNFFTFIPLVLFEQFKYFINLYFLLIASCQFIPQIRTEDPITYWGPLGFVLFVTLIKEAVDDTIRLWRDIEINNQKYDKICKNGNIIVKSKNIKVGDLIIIEKDKRIPADVVLIRTTEKTGACFVRTDQLDGETDWKLRLAIPFTQNLAEDSEILDLDFEIFAEKPQKDIHAFVGTYRINTVEGVTDGGLNVENVLWANTVLASGTAIGLVVYTGRETRSVMNTTLPESK